MRTKIAVLALALTLSFIKSGHAQSSAPKIERGTAEHVHVVNSFRFEVAASMERVAPLFALEVERNWAGEHWKPVFL